MNIDNDEHPTILEYIEAAYLHGLCVENLNTGELEPPRDISEVAWIAEAIEQRFAAQRQALRDEVLEAIKGVEIDMEATEKHIHSLDISEDEKAEALLSAQIDYDDRHDTLKDVIAAISTIFEGKK